jgi:ribosomal protein L29
MKTAEEMKALQAMKLAELDTNLETKKSELFNLRFQKATGQLENTAAIRECKKAAFGTLEHLLYYHGISRSPKSAIKALRHARQRLFGSLGHDDALARSQAVGLNDAGTRQLAHVDLTCRAICEAAIRRSRHIGACHDLLGKLLGAFHTCRRCIWPKAGDALRTHSIRHAFHERSLRSHYHKSNAVLRCPVSDLGGGVLIHRSELSHLQHATVAWRHVELAGSGRIAQFHEQGVLATARPKQQNVYLFHFGPSDSIYTCPAYSQNSPSFPIARSLNRLARLLVGYFVSHFRTLIPKW